MPTKPYFSEPLFCARNEPSTSTDVPAYFVGKYYHHFPILGHDMLDNFHGAPKSEHPSYIRSMGLEVAVGRGHPTQPRLPPNVWGSG